MPFDDSMYAQYSPSDLDSSLDLSAVEALRVGVNTSADEAQLEVRNIRAVRFAAAEPPKEARDEK